MKLYFSLAFHNHQPVGNFGWVFEEAFNKSYLPMVECLERHPRIRVALHYTGPLRDWLAQARPEFIPRVRALVERNQIEIMTGGYYEPVLVSLTDVDKVGQIKKLTEAVKSDFGFDATGLWLAERIWEPHLPKCLNDAGISYTIVDDTHFKGVGYKDEDLLGYFLTEDQGKVVKVFATSMTLRYSIPWKPVPDVISWLKEQYEMQHARGLNPERPVLALMGDDGEKFGMWPSTYEHVWQGGWMDRLFEAIEQSSAWLETIPPGEFANRFTSIGRVYLPTSSYDEMGEWSLPPDRAYDLHTVKHYLAEKHEDTALGFMRGGHWRSFMVKYSEVNQLHKKALLVSDKVNSLPDSKVKSEALDFLWAGQCNCGYWHGTFGGIYLFHIREADYRNLVRAENLADGIQQSGHSTPFAIVNVADFDLDGNDDVVITTDQQTLTIMPALGGALTEWDFRAAEYNLLNVLTRRKEGHHKTLVDAALAGKIITPNSPPASPDSGPRNIHSLEVMAREDHLDHKLVYDSYQRASFIDHFFDDADDVEAFYKAGLSELGDFVESRYDIVSHSEIEGQIIVEQARLGRVVLQGGEQPVKVSKVVSIRPSSLNLSVDYQVENASQTDVAVRFGIETNWGLAGGNDDHTTFNTIHGPGRLGDIVSNSNIDTWEIDSRLWDIKISARASRQFTTWRFPLETISLSEGGYERNYQGTTILIWWTLSLRPDERWETRVDFDLSRNQ